MKLMSRCMMRSAATAAMLMGAGLAQAHTGHGTSTLFDGLAHPFALDHLLAALAVGLWSVAALPAGKAMRGPAAFLLALSAGALLAATGVAMPFVEQGIALSVVLFGALLVLTCRGTAISAGWGIGMVAAGGLLHGMAHGAEAPAAGFAAYAAGFLITTAMLHLGGVSGGLALRRMDTGTGRAIVACLGGLLGGAGLYLFSQI